MSEQPSVSNDRLEELIAVYLKETCDAIPWVGENPLEKDVYDALCELKRLRDKP